MFNIKNLTQILISYNLFNNMHFFLRDRFKLSFNNISNTMSLLVSFIIILINNEKLMIGFMLKDLQRIYKSNEKNKMIYYIHHIITIDCMMLSINNVNSKEIWDTTTFLESSNIMLNINHFVRENISNKKVRVLSLLLHTISYVYFRVLIFSSYIYKNFNIILEGRLNYRVFIYCFILYNIGTIWSYMLFKKLRKEIRNMLKNDNKSCEICKGWGIVKSAIKDTCSCTSVCVDCENKDKTPYIECKICLGSGENLKYKSIKPKED